MGATTWIGLNALVDLVVLITWLIATQPHMSGMSIHEWIGMAFGVTGLVHLLLHWRWMWATLTRFIGSMGMWQRVSLLLNIALLIDAAAIVYTGLNISRFVVPALGGTAVRGPHGTHSLASNLFYVLGALHIVLHLKWIGQTFKRFFIQPFVGKKA